MVCKDHHQDGEDGYEQCHGDDRGLVKRLDFKKETSADRAEKLTFIAA